MKDCNTVPECQQSVEDEKVVALASWRRIFKLAQMTSAFENAIRWLAGGSRRAWPVQLALAIGCVAPPAPAAEGLESLANTPAVLTNAAAVRDLSLEEAGRKIPVRLRGVVTFDFDARSCFVQDQSAGIYVGTGTGFPPLAAGDVVVVEGVTGPGEYAPIVQPTAVRVVGHEDLPPPRRVLFEDLMTGREDSQWVELVGLVRSVQGESTGQQILEIATGGGRLTAFVPRSTQSNSVNWVDARVRVRGVCGTWFNKLRQLFGFRLMVPRPEDIVVEEPALADASAQTALPIGHLLRFDPHAAYGHRVKVAATVVLQQPGGALFVQDDLHGVYVQTRQQGALQPGDRVELIGFPARGDYTPVLQDAVWRKTGSGPEPAAALISPDEALAGLQDSRLVSIEGRLLDHTYNNRETVLVLEAGGHIFSAHLDSQDGRAPLAALRDHSRLRLTGVCRIEVGDDWRAGPDWRAKSFRVLLRSPGDVQVLGLPPWWTLSRLLWAVGILASVLVASLSWVTLLRRKVGQQTTIIRQQLDLEAALKERFQDLFESANDMVYTHDLTGRITSINLAGEQLLGRSRGSLAQRCLLEFMVEEQQPSAAQWLEHIVDGSAPPTVEWDFITAQGDRVRLEIRTRLIEHEGRQVEVEGIARDVTERHRLEKEILEISAREQYRIGHDLHDGVCQQLAGISFLSDILADKLAEQSRPESSDARRITELVNQANKQTRGVARGLFPVRLEENGVISALEELTANAGAFFNTRCEFHCDEPIAVRDHAVAHHLYFIAQEAILNAVKHGKARLIQVSLAADGVRGSVLAVQDDGLGLGAASSESPGIGIRIMKYRARMIGAEVQVRPRPEGGTELVCRFSCAARDPTDLPHHSRVGRVG
jgi:PAS domain S-box-containing protein